MRGALGAGCEQFTQLRPVPQVAQAGQRIPCVCLLIGGDAGSGGRGIPHQLTQPRSPLFTRGDLHPCCGEGAGGGGERLLRDGARIPGFGAGIAGAAGFCGVIVKLTGEKHHTAGGGVFVGEHGFLLGHSGACDRLVAGCIVCPGRTGAGPPGLIFVYGPFNTEHFKQQLQGGAAQLHAGFQGGD